MPARAKLTARADLENITALDSLDARPIVENTPANLDVTQSSLFSSAPDGSWAADMPRELERLLHNVTLSLVANGFTFGSRLKLNATISTSQTQFYYRHEGLWIPYGVAFALVALCCLDGLVAVHSNRFGARGGFKAFIKFTREIKLGQLAGKVGEARVQYFTADGMGRRGGFVLVGNGWETQRRKSYSV